MPARMSTNPFPTYGTGATPLDFPGRGNNPVGFAAAPGYPGSLTGTSWPPALAGGDAGSPAWGSGTAGNPTLVKYRDFNSPGFYPVSIDGLDSSGPVNHVKFIGCRWQSNDSIHFVVECFKSGSSDITFSYCSVTPLTSLWTAPKGFTRWPTAGALTGAYTDGTPATAALRDPYTIPYADGYIFGMALAANAGGVVTADHCDVWGSGFGITTGNTGVGRVVITDNWVHDSRNDANDLDHTDGIGNASGNFLDSNILVQHNTICSIGTTRGGSWQRSANLWVSGTAYGAGNYAVDPTNRLAYFALNNLGSSVVQPHLDPANWQQNGQGFYSNYQVINNYFSGWFNTIDAFGRQAGTTPACINLVFTDNVWATDLSCVASPIYEDQQTQFNVANFNCLWRRNRMLLVPNDNWSSTFLDTASQPISNYAGQFLLPVRNTSATWATTFSTVDWAN